MDSNCIGHITEVVVEVALFLVAGHAIGVLVKTSDILGVGIADVIVRSRSLGQDHAADPVM
jgi:hypothetical protein